MKTSKTNKLMKLKLIKELVKKTITTYKDLVKLIYLPHNYHLIVNMGRLFKDKDWI